MKFKKSTIEILDNTNGFQTHVWGPVDWFFLHCVVMNFDPNKSDIRGYKSFFKNLRHVLPCKSCRDNYTKTIMYHKTLKLSNEIFSSRENLVYWLFSLHNYVRKCQNNKKLIYENTPNDFHKHVCKYSRYRAKCDNIVKSSHTGCTTPMKSGLRLRSKIIVVPRSIKQP